MTVTAGRLASVVVAAICRLGTLRLLHNTEKLSSTLTRDSPAHKIEYIPPFLFSSFTFLIFVVHVFIFILPSSVDSRTIPPKFNLKREREEEPTNFPFSAYFSREKATLDRTQCGERERSLARRFAR